MKTLRRRGAATVELAVLMIVLIPTIMYTMFLEDLLFYKFDLAETVVSTAWDFAPQDFRKESTANIKGSVVQASMQTFWDHTSAWNSYSDPNYDAKETVHHQAYGAHECWLGQGGQQIECDFDSTVGLLVEPTFIWKNKGGLAHCNAILGVQNYFLVNSFFMDFGKGRVDSMTGKMKHHTAGQSAIHTEASTDPYLYPRLTFGVVHDPWALYKTDDINPNTHPLDQLTEFSSWVRIPYGLRAGNLSDANKFADDAINKDILGGQVKIDGIGDTLITPPLAWKKDPKREFSNHTASGWMDSRHQQTQTTMKNNYMGVAETTW